MEADQDRLAEGHLIRRAQNVALGVGYNRVAALEDFQRAALLELQAQAFDAFAFGAQQAFGSQAEFSALLLYPHTHRRNARAKIEACDSQMRQREKATRLFQPPAQTLRQPSGHFIRTLPPLT